MSLPLNYNKAFWIQTATIVNPAAGADFLVTVPAGVTWYVIAVNATLVTSATAATRVPQIQIKDSGGHLLYMESGQSQIASLTGIWSWAPAVPTSQANNVAVVPLPAELYLQGGATIGTTTPNIQAGDQWSNISVYVLQLAEA